MKSSLIIALLLFFVSCGKDENLRVIHNNGRVSLLEAQMQLNNANDAIQDARLDALEASVAQLNQDLNDGLSSLQSDISNLSNVVNSNDEDVNDRIDALVARVEALESDMGDLDEQVSEIEVELASLAQDLGELDSQVSAAISSINSQINSLKARTLALEISQAIQNVLLAYLSGQVSSLSNSLTSLQSQVNMQASQINSLVSQISGITSQINSINTQLQSVATQAQLQALADQIAALGSTVSALQTQVYNPEASSPEEQVSCVVNQFASYYGQKRYSFTVNGLSNYTSYELEVKFTHPISYVLNSNGGQDSLSSNGKTWTIEPQSSASSFNFYTYFSGSNREVQSAKVTKGSTTTNCAVNN